MFTIELTEAEIEIVLKVLGVISSQKAMQDLADQAQELDMGY